MLPVVHIDASEYDRAAANLMALPARLKAKAFARASRAVAKDMQRAVVRNSSQRLSLAQKWINQGYRTINTGGGTVDAVVRSGWIPLIRLGSSKPGKRGVSVRGQSQVRGSFIATMPSGHVGIFKREGASRLPIGELFGPNPATDIINNPDSFEDAMIEVGKNSFAPRLIKAVRDELYKAMR